MASEVWLRLWLLASAVILITGWLMAARVARLSPIAVATGVACLAVYMGFGLPAATS